MKKSCFVIWKVREKKSPFSSHTQPKSFDNKAKTWLIISNDSWLSLYKVDKYWSRKYQVPISLGLKKKKRRQIWALDFSLIRFCQLTIKYSKEKCQYVYIYIYIYIRLRQFLPEEFHRPALKPNAREENIFFLKGIAILFWPTAKRKTIQKSLKTRLKSYFT